jgi:cyanophycinase
MQLRFLKGNFAAGTSMRFMIILLLSILCTCSTATAQGTMKPRKLLICGGGRLPDAVFKRFRELAGPKPKLVVIPTASQRETNLQELRDLWSARGFEDVQVLHSNNRAITATKEFASPLSTATAVWFGGGSQQRIADAYLDTPVEAELQRLLQRGGVIGGTSAGAAIQTRVMIASGRTEPTISKGLDLLGGAIVDQHFLKRNRIPRLLEAIRKHPELIGFGIDEGTALVIDEETAEVVGNSYVLRVESIDGKMSIESFGDRDKLPLKKRPATLSK